MAYRNSNYTAFYVSEPFNSGALGAHATKDFCFYNLLRSWKGADASFPFYDAHSKTYNVRDGSDWEKTLKPRLRERIRASKNIILILSSETKNSRALREEIDYGINDQGLPLIVIYPEFPTKESLLANGNLSSKVKSLWDIIPTLKNSISDVPTIHIPMKKDLVRKALEDTDLMVGTKCSEGCFHYN
nr:TIR domain-containing protein [uncultured Cohaesibacter sp.]